MEFKEVEEKIAERPVLDFGSIFSNSLELFKKVWVQGFVILLLTFVCIIPLYILVYLPFVAMGIWNPEMFQEQEPNAVMVLTFLCVLPVLLIGMATLTLGLMAAFLRICRSKDLNLEESDDYFYFFKNGRLRKLVVLGAMYLGISLLGLLVCGVGILYLVVPLSLVPAFVAFDEECTPKEIMKASFQLGNKNWLVIFGLIIIMGLLAELGFILCFVGVFFTAMLAKIPIYYSYKDGVGFENDDKRYLEN